LIRKDSMENGPLEVGDGEAETPFYSTFSFPPLSDEDVLPLYAIYRQVSGGQTLEPYESLLKAHPQVTEHRYDDEQAA
jgi:hypothetical protein